MIYYYQNQGRFRYLVCIMIVFIVNVSCSDNALKKRQQEKILEKRAGIVLASISDGNNLIAASDLNNDIIDDYNVSGYYLLDTRPYDEWYKQGHIKYAVLINMQKVADNKNLALLPKHKTIVCISPTSQTAVQVSSTLRWLGYDTLILEHGMASWMPTPAGQMMINDIMNGIAKPYPVVKEHTGAVGYAEEEINIVLKTMTEGEFIILAKAARTMLRNNIVGKRFPFNNIFADDLYKQLQSQERKDNIYLLDIRPDNSWEKTGHMDGAHHINLKSLVSSDNLKKLPKDKLIIVICDTGLISGQVTPVLRMLGYNAVTLRSGMMAWTDTPDSHKALEILKNGDYPVVRD